MKFQDTTRSVVPQCGTTLRVVRGKHAAQRRHAFRGDNCPHTTRSVVLHCGTTLRIVMERHDAERRTTLWYDAPRRNLESGRRTRCSTKSQYDAERRTTMWYDAPRRNLESGSLTRWSTKSQYDAERRTTLWHDAPRRDEPSARSGYCFAAIVSATGRTTAGMMWLSTSSWQMRR